MSDKDTKTWNDLAKEITELQEENKKLKREISENKRIEMKIASILESYNFAKFNKKEKGCEYCNECHPEYNDSCGITTIDDRHYLIIQTEWNRELDTWDTKEIEMNFCFNCGRDLSKPVDLNAWGVNNELNET